jgi:hypothetical protein
MLAEVLRPTWNLLLALVCVRWRKGRGGGERRSGGGGEGGSLASADKSNTKTGNRRGWYESHIRSLHCTMLTYMKQNGGDNRLWQRGDRACTAVVEHATQVCEPGEEVE